MKIVYTEDEVRDMQGKFLFQEQQHVSLPVTLALGRGIKFPQ